MIAIKKVSKWYGEFKVLAGCTTQIEKGEVVVVCGPSGSGKSTLIKCVNGLEPFQEGEIIVNGESVGAKETKTQDFTVDASAGKTASLGLLEVMPAIELPLASKH